MTLRVARHAYSFADGTAYQLLTITGDTTKGYVGTLEIGIAL